MCIILSHPHQRGRSTNQKLSVSPPSNPLPQYLPNHFITQSIQFNSIYFNIWLKIKKCNQYVYIYNCLYSVYNNNNNKNALIWSKKSTIKSNVFLTVLVAYNVQYRMYPTGVYYYIYMYIWLTFFFINEVTFQFQFFACGQSPTNVRVQCTLYSIRCILQYRMFT